MGVVVLNEVIDFCGQVLDAPESSPSNHLLSDQVEPDLHLVKPGGIGRRQMDVKARMQGQPALHPGMLMSGVVVDNQMDIETFRNVGIDLFEEVEIVLVTMAPLAPSDDSALGDVKSGVEGQGSVPDIVVSHALLVSQAHVQNRLSPVQGLNLACSPSVLNHRKPYILFSKQ